jgi:hypothetical protein
VQDPTRAGGGSDLWEQFAQQHAQQPYLVLNPLYALPPEFLDIVKTELPGLWSPAEEAFERSLAAAATGGFFHQWPFACPLTPPPPPPAWDQQRQQLDHLLTEAATAGGRSQLQIANYKKAERQQEEDLQLRALAYTAWLVTDPQFRTERDAVRVTWESRVGAHGFPSHRRSWLGERPKPVDGDEARLLLFYRRWGLETFATWDLPVPMPPQLSGLTYADPVTLPGAGLLVFVPWYALKDERLTLKDLAKQVAEVTRPDHLKVWMARGGSKAKLGYQRLRHTLVLYRYWNLGLASRYADRIAHQVERLDRAFAEYLGLSTDSVKKVRLRLDKALAAPRGESTGGARAGGN